MADIIVTPKFGDRVIIQMPMRPKPQVIEVKTANSDNRDYSEVYAYMSTIAALFDLSLNEILSKSRIELIVAVRWYLMSYMRTDKKMSCAAIGRVLNRDHSTVSQCHRKRIDLLVVGDQLTLEVLNTIQNYEEDKNKAKL